MTERRPTRIIRSIWRGSGAGSAAIAAVVDRQIALTARRYSARLNGGSEEQPPTTNVSGTRSPAIELSTRGRAEEEIRITTGTVPGTGATESLVVPTQPPY